MPDHSARLARVALAVVSPRGHRTAQVHALVAEHGPVGALGRLLAGSYPGAEPGARRLPADTWKRAEAALRFTEQIGARVLIPEDGQWPSPVDDLLRLGTGPDTVPPHCLWVRGRGDLDALLDRSVAVVGARKCSAYGAHVSADLSQGLAERGWTVVSGGAYGVDSFALRGALSAGGRCVVVLSAGLDQVSVATLEGLFERVAADGLLVSEWPPGSVPLSFRFEMSNRLLAAATRGVVMVEGTPDSKALLTLGHALALGRQPMAVPGPVTSLLSAGCHQFLRAHPRARPVTDAGEVVTDVESGLA